MADLERAWDDFEAVCTRTRGIRFRPVDLAPMRAHFDIPDDVASLWQQRYPEQPIQLDELLFPQPLMIAKVIEERYQEGEFPRSNVLCSDPDAGHYSYQLHRGRMFLLSDEELPEGDSLRLDGPDLAYPDLIAFVIAATQTLSATSESAFETRTKKGWFRTETTRHFDHEFCRKLQATWRYPGFPPLLLRTPALSEVIPPPEYADLMRER